jgi:hypothetical protein
MGAVFSSRLLMTLVVIPALADPISANTNTPAFTYRSSGTCLASPAGFNSKCLSKNNLNRLSYL